MYQLLCRQAEVNAEVNTENSFTVFQTQLHWEFSAYNHYWEGLRCSLFLEWILVICACPVCLLTSFLPFDSSYQMITSAGMFELLGVRGGGDCSFLSKVYL